MRFKIGSSEEGLGDDPAKAWIGVAMSWPKFLFSPDRMKVIQRFLDYQKKQMKRVKLGVFELALLIDKAWSSGLDSEEIDTSLTYYEAKRDLENRVSKINH